MNASTALVVENQGQFADPARFQIKLGDMTVWVTAEAVWLASPTAGGVRFTFPGANPNPALVPFGPAPVHVSYLIGADPTSWRRDVPVWSSVRYRDLYPGVDLVIGDRVTGAIPWRFETRRGAQVQGVSVRAEGADSVTVDAGIMRLQVGKQTLKVALPAWSLQGQVELSATTAKQEAEGATFAVAPDAQQGFSPQPLAAPAAGDLIYSINLGGGAYDEGLGIDVDYQGNAYVTGATKSGNFPTLGAYDSSHNGLGTDDAFLAKYSPTGTLLYATYLGGAGDDTGNAVTVEGGLAYVAGETTSSDFPGMAVSDTSTDAFVAAFSQSGSALRYTRRIGGNDFDTAAAIAVEGLDAYVVGSTYSTNLAGSGCGNPDNGQELLVARLNASGAPVYASCFGGDGLDTGNGIAVRNQTAYVTGETQSSNLPGLSLKGPSDILVAKFDAAGFPTGSTLVGGDDQDAGLDVALDGSGNIYLAGTTYSSSGFPMSTGPWGGGTTDGIVLQLQPSLTLVSATYVGGSGDDSADHIALDTVNALYIGGTTTGGFAVTLGAYATTPFGGMDFFVARMHANVLTYATYLGTANDDWDGGVATDTGGYAFVTGAGNATGFLAPVSDYAYVAKVKVSSPPGQPSVTIATNGSNAKLAWSAVATAYNYQVFRSSAPYFVPGDSSSPLPVAEPESLGYTDSGALMQADGRFYVVKAVSDAPAAGGDSNRVGKFTFGLTPGN